MLAFVFPVPPSAAGGFESPPVHPIDLAPDGVTLLSVHTPVHRLVVFDLAPPAAPVARGEVAVGLEPVTVRARANGTAWVVNHVSDSISIVDLATMSVVRTLLAGDEPTDVVFDEPRGRAYVCVSQEDLVRVYDLGNLDAVPVDIPLEGSDPRSLALSPDGASVWVTVHDSGNETTSIPFEVVTNNGGLPAPFPPMDGGLPPAPQTALIVRHDGQHWVDETDTSWDAVVPYRLYDHDVFRIDAATRTVASAVNGVGTTLFNVGVHPITGELWVTNQEAINEVRFEPNLRGAFVDSRISSIDPLTGTPQAFPLNPHIDRNDPDGTALERSQSLSLPTDVVVSGARSEIYVAGTGSAKVGVYDLAGQPLRLVATGLGPAGLALDDAGGWLYVHNRFSGSVTVVDLLDDSTVEIPLGYDPTEAAVKQGQRLFYDGESSSAHGDLSCATCHLFAGMDNLAWDLGDPGGAYGPPDPLMSAAMDSIFGFPLEGAHPMKGPMTTQSLKSLPGTERFHWRGDREDLPAFNGAFPSLLGRSAPLTGTEMQQFEDFVFSVRYPPNPFRELDGSLPPALGSGNPAAGEAAFNTGEIPSPLDCAFCHAPPTGENGFIIPKDILLDDQDFVVPQLRNMYEKTRFDATQPWTVRGFGYFPDGSFPTLLDFLGGRIQFEWENEQEKLDVASFLLCWDTGTPAGVGAQWTMDGTNQSAGSARVVTLCTQADLGRIGLFAKGRDGSGEHRGWTRISGQWQSDRAAEPPVNTAVLLALAGAGREITFTGCLPGDEMRLGIDRDGDGWLDRDELDVGSDPGDPASTPDQVGAPVLAGGGTPGLWLSGANPARVASRISFELPGAGRARLEIFDVTGRRVRMLDDRPDWPAGVHERSWNLLDDRGRRVTAGVYFVRLKSATGVADGRVVVLR